MKKQKIKKFFKEINAELARFDNRLDDLERNEPIKVFMAPQPILEEPKEELKELPEKWCVPYDETLFEIISRFLNWKSEPTTKKGYLAMDKTEIYHLSNSRNGYPKISFSDFKRLVLDKEQSNNPLQLEIGKWYIDTDVKGVEQYLICLTKFDDLGVEGYGFIDGRWFSNGNNYRSKLRLADYSEVETALTNEAKSRGFKKDVIFKSVLNDAIGTLSSDEFEYCPKNNSLQSIDGYPSGIFINGIWAEIIEQPEEVKQEIDFSLPGQFVNISYKDFSNTVVTSGKHDGNIFEGLCIKSTKESQVGTFLLGWTKDNTSLKNVN